ncbi:hypothetical protein LZ32DRAFT_219900 [Colletotrichum eremochloae]|nr:hypothetical protein LZ32DRAFT_219900 [Colletotrichum eremochloae]
MEGRNTASAMPEALQSLFLACRLTGGVTAHPCSPRRWELRQVGGGVVISQVRAKEGENSAAPEPWASQLAPALELSPQISPARHHHHHHHHTTPPPSLPFSSYTPPP